MRAATGLPCGFISLAGVVCVWWSGLIFCGGSCLHSQPEKVSASTFCEWGCQADCMTWFVRSGARGGRTRSGHGFGVSAPPQWRFQWKKRAGGHGRTKHLPRLRSLGKVLINQEIKWPSGCGVLLAVTYVTFSEQH